MTSIDLDAEYLDEYTSLTEEVNDTRLVHVEGIQFAILGPVNYILFSFESIALALHIRNDRHFKTFKFAQTRTAAGAGPVDEKILFIWRSDHGGIVLNERDEIALLENPGQKKLASATKAFGLPPTKHLARMLMTERLIGKVESVSEGHGPTVEQILYLMYRESLKARRSESYHGQPIAGEHFIFETKNFNDQLIVFDLTELT